MKNPFSKHLLIKLSLIFTNCVLIHQPFEAAENEEYREVKEWFQQAEVHADKYAANYFQDLLENGEALFDTAQDNITKRANLMEGSKSSPAMYSPGQIFFPIEQNQPQSSTASNVKSTSQPETGKAAENRPDPGISYKPSSMPIRRDEPEGNSQRSDTATSNQARMAQSALLTDDVQNEKGPSPTENSKAQQTKRTEDPKSPHKNASSLDPAGQTILINFNNVNIIEYIRFVSRVTGKNFVFDENDLQFNVSIVSEEPTSIENMMTALLQELRIHNLELLEQGNNLIIHKNPKVNSISQLVAEGVSQPNPQKDLVTQVFRLNTASAEKVAVVLRPLMSETALIEVLKETNNLILTDIVSNMREVAKLIKSVDSPDTGLVIGQYVVRTSSIDALIPIVQKIMGPIAANQPLTLVPWETSNSIFIVSSPYLVERTISMLQHVDQNERATKIFTPEEMMYESLAKELAKEHLPPAGLFVNEEPYNPLAKPVIPPPPPTVHPVIPPGTPGYELGHWHVGEEDNWIFELEAPPGVEWKKPPEGQWKIDTQGNWYFVPGAVQTSPTAPQPKGSWKLSETGNWTFHLVKGEVPTIKVLARPSQDNAIIPLGPKKGNMFYIYKLKYRKGDAIQMALQSIANSLTANGKNNDDLVNALLSVQWLEPSNSMIFTGPEEVLMKMQDLMEEVDVPLRQVFIEMLVVVTTITDSLTFGVNWGSRFGGGGWAGAQGFNTQGSPLNAALASTGTNNLGGVQPAGTFPGVLTPDPRGLVQTAGFNLGVLGTKIYNTATGVEFSSIGALVSAFNQRSIDNIILNPKIITEDNVPAEIFVGQNVPFLTQSISNDLGSILTSNYQYQDIGTRLRVTPTIGNGDIITLEIAEEQSSIVQQSTVSTGVTGLPTGPTTNKTTTTTRVHLPDGYFLIISGLIRNEEIRARNQVPCLGGIPVLGAAFSQINDGPDNKNTLMIFIRPQIIDTEEELQNLTRHQQDLMRYKDHCLKDWVYEQEEMMNWLNLRRTPNVEPNPTINEYSDWNFDGL